MKCLIPPLIAGIIFILVLLMLQPDWKSPPLYCCCQPQQVFPLPPQEIDS